MTITVEQLSNRLGLECFGKIQMRIESVANFYSATRSQLTFLTSDKKHQELNHRFNCAVITTGALAGEIKAEAVIISPDPQLSLQKPCH